jgi:tyrosine-protein phosphatase OCA6
MEVEEDLNEQNLYPPLRFAMVKPGVYRGSYPTLPNFRFLSRLQLKTVVSLVPEPITADLNAFVEMAGGNSIHIPIQRVSSLNDALIASLTQALHVIIDTNNHPIFVHCLDGRRITSLLTLLLRRWEGWNNIACLSEYWRFQVAGRSAMATLDVEKQTKDLERFLNDFQDNNGIQTIHR